MAINQLTKLYRISSMTQDYKYTQQEWDKAVGWGKVPENRQNPDEKDINKNGGPDKIPPPQ